MTMPQITAVRAAAAAAKLPTDAAIVLERLVVHVAAAAWAGQPFVIQLDRVALETGRTHAAVAHAVADLMGAGWLTLDAAARWNVAIAPRHVPAARPAVPLEKP